MKLYDWNRVEEEQMNPLLARKVIHGDNLTVARIRLQKYAVVPRHSHTHEQVTMLQSGKLRFVLDDGEQILNAGELMEIAPNEAHLVEALEDSVAIDVFAPMRDDWARGDDAYLRK